MKSFYLFLVLITGLGGTYMIWENNSSVEIPNKKMVYEQVDNRKLTKFLNLLEDFSSKHRGHDEIEDSLNTIMSASKKLTIKTEVMSHAKNLSSPFPWGMMISLWGSLGIVALLISRNNQIAKTSEESTSEKNQKSAQYFASERSIGDLNQSVVSVNRQLELQAQKLDRYIDLELREDLSDCFVEKKRLENLVGNFMQASFQLIKSDDESKGMIIQTNEDDGRYRLICFLDNFDQNHLSNHRLPELLKHFSVLEKQFSGVKPTIDFHYVEHKNHQGLEIELSFDNSSEFEARLLRSVQV